MTENTFIDDRNNFRWKDVLGTGLRVFIAGIDGATGVAQVSGGGGTSSDMPCGVTKMKTISIGLNVPCIMRMPSTTQAIGSNTR